jgi:hypothetical protein
VDSAVTGQAGRNVKWRECSALFLITFITSIPAALLLYSPVLDHTNYILGAGADTRVALGALLEILLINRQR